MCWFCVGLSPGLFPSVCDVSYVRSSQSQGFWSRSQDLENWFQVSYRIQTVSCLQNERLCFSKICKQGPNAKSGQRRKQTRNIKHETLETIEPSGIGAWRSQKKSGIGAWRSQKKSTQWTTQVKISFVNESLHQDSLRHLIIHHNY